MIMPLFAGFPTQLTPHLFLFIFTKGSESFHVLTGITKHRDVSNERIRDSIRMISMFCTKDQEMDSRRHEVLR